MDTQHTLPAVADATARDLPAHSFGYLLSAYFLPRGLFLDPDANGDWDRWSRRRHNLSVLRRYSLVYARRWAALWLLTAGLAPLVGGFLGSLIAIAAGFAVIPALIFVSAKIATAIAGDDPI